jgi:GAF domain-containing protein
MNALSDRIEACLAGDGFSAALQLLVRHFNAEIGTIHRLDPLDGYLYLIAATPGTPEPVLAATRRIAPGKGIAGQAAQTGRPVSHCNLQTSGSVPAGAKTTGAQGALCVPIFAGDRIVGTVGIGCRGERVFSPAETEDLLTAGQAMAPAVERARP